MGASKRMWAGLAVMGVLGTLLAPTAVPPADAAGSTACTIVGTPRADTLVGTPKRDVICGLGGNDVLRGRGGNDLLIGGTGRDRLVGAYGDDRLVGGPGVDQLDGRPGTDLLVQGISSSRLPICRKEPPWDTTPCVPDLEAPVVREVDVPESVDVTNGAATIVMRWRVTDDTGITYVRPDGAPYVPDARLESGSRTDGWWVSEVSIPAHRDPTTLTWWPDVADGWGKEPRVRRYSDVQVLNLKPDDTPPVVEILTPEVGAQLDLGQAPQDVVIEARVTDEGGAGVRSEGWRGGVGLCLSYPADDQREAGTLGCAETTLVSGDVHDGIWRGTFHLWMALPLGTWTISAVATDESTWAEGSSDPSNVSTVVERPVQMVDSAGGTPARIADSVFYSYGATAPGTVPVSVHLTDPDPTGVHAVTVSLHAKDPSLELPPMALELTQGTVNDGTWTGQYSVPAGTAPGHYYGEVWVEDEGHRRGYVSYDSPKSATDPYLRLPSRALVIVD
jgi:hypothetical protein